MYYVNEMDAVLFQFALDPQEEELFRKEFPQYKFLILPESYDQNLTREKWSRVEVLCGNYLNAQHLFSADDLRWVHAPSGSLKHICFQEIKKKGNILVTIGGEESVQQTGEYVIAAVFGFAKNLFDWYEMRKTPKEITSTMQNDIWQVEKRIFLQVGLGKIGTEIARRAQQIGMRVRGAQPRHSFHPYCEKTIALSELPQALPEADVVCICLPHNEEKEHFLTLKELNLLKDDSILIIISTSEIVSEKALATVARHNKIRGIVLDMPSISADSVLWNLPHILLTRDIAARPRIQSQLALHTFHYNLRQYVAGNYRDLRNRVI